MSAQTTEHCDHDPDYCRWNLDPCNEEGWRCDCGEDLGFRPDLDRECTHEKVEAILMYLHESDLVYVSSGEHGEHICFNVAERCHNENRFDQMSIIRFIIEDSDMGTESHAEFWQKEAASGRSGKRKQEEIGPILAALADDWKAKEPSSDGR